MTTKRILLASESPRRKFLLKRLGLRFRVAPSRLDESTVRGAPRARAMRLSREKARVVAARHPGALVIAADTVVALAGKCLGKPRSPREARSMLAILAGRTHSVITGFTVMDAATGKSVTRAITTRVRLRPLSRREIAAYAATREPLGKAGGYAIQGRGAGFVRDISGDFDNVVGLPIAALARALAEFGVHPRIPRRKPKRKPE
ncbi:MAG: Maf family protein [Planctomycetota bacterium]